MVTSYICQNIMVTVILVLIYYETRHRKVEFEVLSPHRDPNKN